MSCQPTSGHAGVGGGHGGQGKATAWGPRPAPCQFLDCQWALDGKTIASKAEICPGCQRERKKAIAAPLAFCCERAFVSKLRTRAGDLHDHNKEAAKACAGHFRARKVYSGTATAEELAPQLAWRRTQLSSPQAAAQALQDLLVHIAKSSDAAGVTDDGAEDQGGVAATMAGVFSEAAGDLAAPSPPNPKGTPLRLEDHDLGSTPQMQAVFQRFVTSLAEETMPGDLVLPPPLEAVTKATASSELLAKGLARDKAAAEVHSCQIALDAAKAEHNPSQAVVEALEAALKVQQGQLTKAKKDAPLDASTAAGLRAVMSGMGERLEERRRRAQELRDKTAERTAHRDALAATLRNEVEVFLVAVAEAQTRHQEAHDQRAKRRAVHDAEVNALIQRMIADAQMATNAAAAAKNDQEAATAAAAAAKSAAATAQQPAAPSDAALGTATGQSAALLQELQAAKDDTAKAVAAFNRLQAEVDRLTQCNADATAAAAAASAASAAAALLAAEQAERDAAAAPDVGMGSAFSPEEEAALKEEEEDEAYEATVNGISRESLPPPHSPSGNELEAAARAHSCLCAWMDGHQRTRFTFEQLDFHARLNGAVDVFCARHLGSDVFVKWFPSGPRGDAIIPKQMAFLMWSALERIKEQLVREEAARLESATSFAVLVTNGAEKFATSAAKRRKACGKLPAAAATA